MGLLTQAKRDTAKRPQPARLPMWAKWGGGAVQRHRSLSRRVSLGTAARRRIRANGPRAIGRPAATVTEWAEIRELVLARARWACQACGSRSRLDVHHVLKRSQGGSDFDLDQLVALCRRCHEQTNAPYARGRLVVAALGAARFWFTLVKGAGKGATEVVDRWESLWPPSVGGHDTRTSAFAHVGNSRSS